MEFKKMKDPPLRLHLMQATYFVVIGCLASALVIACWSAKGDLRGLFDHLPIFTLIQLVISIAVVAIRKGEVRSASAAARRRILEYDAKTASCSERPLSDCRLALYACYFTLPSVTIVFVASALLFLYYFLYFERSPWPLIAATAMILATAVNFPTMARVRRWIDQQIVLMEIDAARK